MTARNADGSTAVDLGSDRGVRDGPRTSERMRRQRADPDRERLAAEPAHHRRAAISPGVVGSSTQSITLRFHVICKGKPVQGALVYGDAVPFNQFSTPAEQPTGADGLATLTMNRAAGLPGDQQPGAAGDLRPRPQGGRGHPRGVSTRRLVSFPVDLEVSGDQHSGSPAVHSPPGLLCEDRRMPHLRLTDVDEATGLLKEEYDAAIGRAGKVFNIVKSMSLGPGVLHELDGALQGDHVRALEALTAGARAARHRRLSAERLPLLNTRRMQTTSVPRAQTKSWRSMRCTTTARPSCPRRCGRSATTR